MEKDIIYHNLLKELQQTFSEFKVVGVPSSYEQLLLHDIAHELNAVVLFAYHDIQNVASSVFSFSKGENLDLGNLNETMIRFGFQRMEQVEGPGEYSVHGGNILIVQSPYEVRIEMWGDTIEEIRVRNIEDDASSFYQVNAAGISNIADGIRMFYPHGAKDLIGVIEFSNYPDDKSYNLTFRDDTTPTVIDLNSFRRKYGIVSDVSRENDPFFQKEIKEGDYLVHEDYGIGRFKGIRLDRGTGNTFNEYFELEYARNDKLLVPYQDINKLTKYIGTSLEPALTRLATREWKRVKQKVLASIMSRFKELIDLYAQRSVVNGYVFSGDSELQKEFNDSFEYVETQDQTKAWREVREDMESPNPMDRVIVGDVGFGKTEIALRAAFKAYMNNKQTAVLCPTTILADQHYVVFSKRMSQFGVKVKVLSRLQSSGDNAQTLEELKNGDIDVIIGTHALLGKNVQFKDLGLLVVDEEQRFGVMQKEKIKRLKTSIDILSLSATPIPRTLYMGLSGIRDISVLSIPPQSRLPIETHLITRDWDEIAKIMQTEVNERQGQIYFVYNRVTHMFSIKSKLEKLLPDMQFGIANGAMEGPELESAISSFRNKNVNVLICSSIIENGIDIPEANMIIINDAHKFGLAQLYQIRGRVGRSSRKAFCYLVVKDKQDLTDTQKDRIDAILHATTLGSGFEIATRDMQIRGAGNLLGDAQHGNIEAVGFELYYKLLKEFILREEQRREHQETAA